MVHPFSSKVRLILCLAQIVFQIQITLKNVIEIQNTKYILKVKNTKYKLHIMYFKKTLRRPPSRGHGTTKTLSAGDGHYLYLQTQLGEDRCMQFRVIVVTDPPTHPPTNRQDATT